MTTWQGVLLAIAWFLLRFGLPVVFNQVLIRWLKRWDERWLAEAQQAATSGGGCETPCWSILGCPAEKRQNCRAFLDGQWPCWQYFRSADGALAPRCLRCRVFRSAPAPSQAL